jgi:hypothetical protein
VIGSDWSQGGTCRFYEVKTPDGEYYSYMSTFYYTGGSLVVGSNDTNNYINNIILFNGNVIIIKPEGIYAYTKAGNIVSLKVNLRSYFDADTGKQAIQWGQQLFFNMGKLLAAFDGEKIVIMPPVWDWADPDWIPTVRCLANGGEGLIVGFDGRVAIFDGQDWHNLHRLGAYDAVFFTTAYKEANDYLVNGQHPPLVIACTWATGDVPGTTRIFAFYPSFFRPLSPETRSADPSYLVSSAFETDNETVLLARNFQVKARNLSSTFGVRAWGRAAFYPDSTMGFVPLPYSQSSNVAYGTAAETWYTFTFPTALATLTGFQYKIEFVPDHPTANGLLIPAVTDVRINLHKRDSTKLRWWSMQWLCTDDYEFPDGSTSVYSGAEMAQMIWEAAYWLAPVKVEFWQPATGNVAACWVAHYVILRPVMHVAYVDESDITGWIAQVNMEEV